MNLRRALKRAYSSIKSFSLSGESEWISDNFYLLTEFYAIAVKDKNALKKVSLYEKISRFCDEKNFCFGEDELIKCVGAAALSLDESRALEKLFAAKAIISLSEGISFKKAFFEEPIFKFLFSLKDGFSEDFYEKAYIAEKLLSSLGDEFIKSDAETKNACRELLFGYAKRQKIREDEAFYKLSAEAEKQGTTVLKLLFAPEKRNKIIFFSSLFIIFSFLAAASVYFSGIYSLLTFIPFFFASVSLSDAVAAALIKPKITPRLDEKYIDKKALVVISALLDGKDGEIFEKLKKFSFSNPEENIFFCLLADLPDSKTKTGDRDGEIFERARENINALNEKYGDRFCLFFRERSYLESENRFGGKERKRGAIAELIKEIKEGGSESVFGGESFIREIDYIITLDGDTELSVGSASALIAAAAHPINEIKIENGKIKSGFGIIQPEMKTTLESSYSTLFSYISSSYSGGENYACASYSRLEILFGIGSFCGKGIIDVNAYYKLLSGVLPENKILSHDIVEGSILKTRSATDIFLYDSTPKNVCAYYRRGHRWLRGDFQNLSLIKGKILSPFSKARMFYIAFKDLLPLFAVLPIVLAGFIKNINAPAAAVFSVSFLLFPYAITLLRSVFNKNFFAVRFFSKAQSEIKTETLRFAFSLLTLCREAFLALDAFVLAVTRLIKKKKTLEWVTAAQTDAKKYGFSGYVRDGAGSIIVGFILAFFAVKPIIKIFGLLWFIYPLAAAFVSETKLGTGEAKAKLNEKQKKILSAHIKDMWGFFSENVSEDTNFLPPDNIQISPNASIAYRTSPTNIGFYLVSLLSARDIGLIDGNELLKRSEKTLETLLKLPKKNGNFYNWYDIKSCEPLGENYVSSVDMGNFVIMLTAFKEGLFEYKESERGLNKCIEICDFLISESDLRAFVSEKGRISVGLRFGEKIENSFYDTLMSEARMTAFYIAAKRISGVKIWQNLGRTLTRDGKHIGMMSWSGTAFEYFMPALFLPLYKSSFIYESLCFALYENKKSGGIWGRSESGFFGFDAALNYQYRANGIKSLALRKVSDAENVVSPYSSYLSLCVGESAVFDNLKKLYSLGAYGKFGFYEAVDFFGDAHGIIVKSYMAHHVGMSIIACMNALYDNIFVKRTMRDGALAGAKGLLCEKIPVGNAVYFKAGTQKGTKTKTNKRFGKDCGGDLKIISDGENTVTVSAKGCISFEKEYASVFRTVFEKYPEFTPKIRFIRDGKDYNPAGDGSSFEKGEDCASFVASGKDFSGSLKISLSKRGALTFETKAEAIKNYDVVLSFEPILAKEKEFYSHVAFSRLFIESEYDENKKILFFHRRDRVSGKHIMTLAVACGDIKSKIEFSASAKDLPFGDKAENIKPDNKTGACITPFCVFKIKNAEGGRAKIFVSAEKTKEECEKVIAHARCGEGSGKTLVFSEDAEKLYEKLLFGVGGNLTQALCGCDENGLWKHGISGDEKMIFAEISGENIRYAEKLIRAFFELGKAMIKFDLVFSVVERDFYNSPVTRKIKEYIREKGAFAGGKIFVIGSEKLSDAERENFKAAAVLYVSMDGTHFKERENIFNGVITKSGETDEKGGFIGEKYVCINAKKTFSPYGYALSGHRFSSFVTQSSLGYTFYGNAHERKTGVFHGDVLEKSGERIILESENERYDLCACAQNAEFGGGKAVWRGRIGEKSYILTVFVSEKYPLKFIRFESESEAKIRFYCLPSLGSGDFGNCLYSPKRERENVYTLFKKPFSSSGFGFIGALNGEISDNFSVSAEGKSTDFFIGYCPSAAAAKRIISRINERFIGDEEKKAEAFDASITHGDDVFFDKFLPRQIYFCRFLARGGFYQSGGAYGFRDQLQDCLAMIYFKPFEVRNHIFRCCAHQYEDGGVMHWWHTVLKKGVKTDCSDDMLWLPIAASEYFKETGDASFLKKEIFYLDSPEISAGEERYEPIKYQNLKESVYKH